MNLETQYGWTALPFRRDIEVHQLHETAGHREALARMKMIVEDRSLGLITGEIGSGKSTCIRQLASQLDPMKYQPIYISLSGLKPKDFYGELLRNFGEELPFSLTKAKRLWQECLTTRLMQGERTLVVIVDEAQEMSESMIQEIRFIRNQEMDSRSMFPILLIGQPELRRILRLKKYEAIQQRIDLSYHLSGFTKEETKEYIRHQMKEVGGTRPVFSDTAIQMIHGASQGIPRMINQICFQALYDAGKRNDEVIEETHISRVLTDQEKQRGTIG